MNRKDGNLFGEPSGEKKIAPRKDEMDPKHGYNPEQMLHFDRIRAQWTEPREDEKNVEPKLPKRKPRLEDKKK